MSRTILYHDLSCLPVNSLKVSNWPYLGWVIIIIIITVIIAIISIVKVSSESSRAQVLALPR